MNKDEFLQKAAELPVYDAHTHLVGEALPAQDFWQIAHYFWFLREMQGAGYPQDYENLPEDQRIDLFLHAYQKTRSTGMHYAVSRIFKDLYEIELTDKASVQQAIRQVKATSQKPGWAKEVAAKGRVAHTVLNREEHTNFVGLDTCVWVPRIDGMLQQGAQKIFEAPNRAEEAARQAAAVKEQLSAFANRGVTAIMTTINHLGKKSYQNDGTAFADLDDCLIYMLHAICGTAEELQFTVQFFLGMEWGFCSVTAPVNRTDRVLNLYGIFEKYSCRFDLVIASEINNMDVVQAAQIFPHVYVGGMWWFNFRPSTFRDAMEKRFEALASNKSYLSISDSRCIEWCYGKNALIRKLMTDFLLTKIDQGFIDEQGALELARDWLYETPKSLYGV